MNNIDLIKQLIKRLKNSVRLIVVIAVVLWRFVFMAKQSVLFTSTATVFPLNGGGKAGSGLPSAIF
jgi:hypothetical protein